jgi:hypothetical protein
MSALEVLAIIAAIGYSIYLQLKGQSLQAKRLLLLPAILTIIGFSDLYGVRHQLRADDILWITVGAAGSVLIGLAFGAITHLESRDGGLWARMPVRGLWLWGALVAWRVAILLPAAAMHAHIAASATPLLFVLGLNRLAQAGIIASRAMAAGIPFAPDNNERHGNHRNHGNHGHHGSVFAPEDDRWES